MDRLRQDRVGREEGDEAELVRHHSPGDLVPHHQRGAEQHRDVGLQGDPGREPEQPAQLAVDGAERGAQAEAGTQQRDRGHRDEPETPSVPPIAEHELLGGGEVEARVRDRA